MELTSGLEPPNLLITNEVLYRLSYDSTLIQTKLYYIWYSVATFFFHNGQDTQPSRLLIYVLDYFFLRPAHGIINGLDAFAEFGSNLFHGIAF